MKPTGPAERNAVVTLAVGLPYFEMAVALVNSCRVVAGTGFRYVIFTDIVVTKPPSWGPEVEVFQITPDSAYPGNRWGARMQKAIPLVHPTLEDCNVLFIDADSIVQRECLAALFHRIKEDHVILRCRDFPDDYVWRRRRAVRAGMESEFNLRAKAAKHGFDVRNLKVNGGIYGCSASTIGREFSRRFCELLDRPPFRVWDDDDYLSMEPFLSIAYQEVARANRLRNWEMPVETYYSTADPLLLAEFDQRVRLDEQERITLELASGRVTPAIVHFSGEFCQASAPYRHLLRKFAA